jgi:AcrR family transcriptional regulator
VLCCAEVFKVDRFYTNRYNRMMIDNRKVIQNCALELFAIRGYDAVGVQEIVDAAGITKPTLYHYFGSKHGLLEDVLSEHFGSLNKEVEEAAHYEGDLVLTLEKTTRSFFEFSSRYPIFYRLMLSLWFAPKDSEGQKAVSIHNQRLFEVIEFLFLQAVKEHGNMRGRQMNYAATFMGMINTYIGLNLNGFIRLDDRLVYQSVHQFMYGILS